MSDHAAHTWLAVCYDRSGRGYALDACPEERARLMREIGAPNILGEFATPEEAIAAVHLARRSSPAVGKVPVLVG